MKWLAVLVNAIAFTALFVAYGGGAIERPAGVRRALQTYARQLPTGASAMSVPIWQIGVEMSDLDVIRGEFLRATSPEPAGSRPSFSSRRQHRKSSCGESD